MPIPPPVITVITIWSIVIFFLVIVGVIIVNQASTIQASGVAVIPAALAEMDVSSTSVLFVPEALATAGTGTGVIFQTVGADELTVKFLQIVFAEFSATDGAYVFVHRQTSIK